MAVISCWTLQSHSKNCIPNTEGNAAGICANQGVSERSCGTAECGRAAALKVKEIRKVCASDLVR